MVILHIANIDTSVIGGVQYAVPAMIKAQSKYADVCLLNTHGDMINGIQSYKYNYEFDIDKLPEPFNNPDIVIFHELYRFEYISIHRKLVKHGIPYVIIPHGCLSIKAQQKKRVKKIVANTLFFNKFIKNARLIHYLSNNEQDMSAFKKIPSIVIGNGVSIPRNKKSSFSRSDIRFVYIGRLEMHIKGLDILLTAIKKCEHLLRQYGAVFEIYGPDYNGSHDNISKFINELNLNDLVRLDREKFGIDKERILLDASCFVQTSRTEGLPLGPLEALSYGLPCIVTKGVGLGDIIETYGAGYHSENTYEGISKAIELFIHNFNNVENMSQSAIRLIEDNFDIDYVMKKFIDEYYSMFN